MNQECVAMLQEAALKDDVNLLYNAIEVNHVLEQMDSMTIVETPLHIAASCGHVQFANELMRLKPSFATKLNKQGLMPIHVAVQQSQKKMVLRFVKINKEQVRVKGWGDLTPLHLASQRGDIDLLANFLFACPNSIKDVTNKSETALHIAVRYKQYEALQVLIGWLKRTSHTSAMQLEKTTLNWKDEYGNTILHVSALMNDLEALNLLIKTKIDLNAKNLLNSTAIDIATSAWIKNILLKAGAKHGSSITDASTLADKLRSNITIMEKINRFILRIRNDLTEVDRNAFLVVATLVVTTTYQLALSSLGLVDQAIAWDNNTNITALNSTASSTQGHAGTTVVYEGDFLATLILDTLSILVSTSIIFILSRGGTVGKILSVPMLLFAYYYLYL